MPNILSPPSGVLSGTKPALPQPVRPLQKEEPEKREFGDALATRRLIYNNVLASTQTLEPISNQRHTLQLRDVKYADDPKFSYKQQKEAILKTIHPIGGECDFTCARPNPWRPPSTLANFLFRVTVAVVIVVAGWRPPPVSCRRQ